MHQGIVRLKIPASVKSKGKRPTEQPLGQIQQFFSNNNHRERNLSHKDEASRMPPTPNLQFIKQNKMRQATMSGQCGSAIGSKLAVNKSLNEYDDMDDEATTHSSRMVCPSHPHKRAKYFLASNTNVRFCTKCAITMAERQPILDEQKYHKINEIDKFRDTIKIVKQDISDKEPEAEELSKMFEYSYSQTVAQVNQQFESVIQLLKSKQNQALKQLESRYNSGRQSIKQYKESIQLASNAMDKYLYDVNRNYEDIVQDLSISHFNDIMEQYQAKICDYMQKINNNPQLQLNSSQYVSRLTEVTHLLKRESAGIRSPAMADRKENIMMHTNQILKLNKSKTPDRHIR